MKHPPDSLLLALARGGAEPQREPGLRAHLEACAACRRRVEAYRDVDAWLGEWNEGAGERDLTDAVLARLRAAPARPGSYISSWYRATRVAAAVLIGAAVGYAGSTAMRSAPAPALPAGAPAIGADVGLPGEGLLAAPSASGLWRTLADLDATEDGA